MSVIVLRNINEKQMVMFFSDMALITKILVKIMVQNSDVSDIFSKWDFYTFTSELSPLIHISSNIIPAML
jgi:hypothetical protein